MNSIKNDDKPLSGTKLKKQKMRSINQKSKRNFLDGIVLLLSLTLNAQDIQYGLNDKVGKHLDVGDASIYYETYGEGSPILLLHGGMFGYIDEFANYIPKLSKGHEYYHY